MRAHWNDNFTAAMLTADDGDIVGWLRIRPWHRPGEREPTPAWVAEVLRHDRAEPKLTSKAVELPAAEADDPARRLPAAEADDPARREHLERLAKQVLAAPLSESTDPPAGPVGPMSPDELHALLGRLLSAYADAESRFIRATELDVEAGAAARFVALAELLFWTYTVDEVLRTAWTRLSPEVRERASEDADARARKTIERNRRMAAQHDFGYDDDAHRAFEAFRQRQTDGRPYAHWSSLLLAGIFGPSFFKALAWIRGKVTHEGVPEPIEIRQLQPGTEPRWQWKRADAVVRGGRADSQRNLYDSELAERDVVGLFSWLIEIFVDARWLLYRLQRPGDGSE